MIARNITSRILEALFDTPIVFLRGARQTGKTTIVKELAKHSHPMASITIYGIFIQTLVDVVNKIRFQILHLNQFL